MIKKSTTSIAKSKMIVRKVRKVRKPTGELALFKEIYEQRGMRCQITGQLLEFDVNSFAHILSKGAYGKFRLNPDNIIMVKPEIHHLYDDSSKVKLLKAYPNASIIYELKDRLKCEYNRLNS